MEMGIASAGAGVAAWVCVRQAREIGNTHLVRCACFLVDPPPFLAAAALVVGDASSGARDLLMCELLFGATMWKEWIV
jgi:hypothetical protein